MPLKSKQKAHSEIRELNLVPLMDVLLTILTFFIVVSMTLSGQQNSVDINLPTTDSGSTTVPLPDPLVVQMNQRGQVFVKDKPANDTQLTQELQSYLVQNPKGVVVLKADSKLAYEQVIKVLGKMQDIGGDRVSLAINQG